MSFLKKRLWTPGSLALGLRCDGNEVSVERQRGCAVGVVVGYAVAGCW